MCVNAYECSIYNKTYFINNILISTIYYLHKIVRERMYINNYRLYIYYYKHVIQKLQLSTKMHLYT